MLKLYNFIKIDYIFNDCIVLINASWNTIKDNLKSDNMALVQSMLEQNLYDLQVNAWRNYSKRQINTIKDPVFRKALNLWANVYGVYNSPAFTGYILKDDFVQRVFSDRGDFRGDFIEISIYAYYGDDVEEMIFCIPYNEIRLRDFNNWDHKDFKNFWDYYVYKYNLH